MTLDPKAVEAARAYWQERWKRTYIPKGLLEGILEAYERKRPEYFDQQPQTGQIPNLVKRWMTKHLGFTFNNKPEGE